MYFKYNLSLAILYLCLKRVIIVREKTFRLIHITYVLFITNLISILYLSLGLFSLTLVPVIFTNIKISTMLLNDEIDGYSGIWQIFNSTIKKYFKNNKVSILLNGVYTLTLVVSIILLRRIEWQIAGILNYFFIYLYIVITVYWAYYSLYLIIKKKSIKYIDALAIMFMKPKKLFITVASFILIGILSLIRREFLVLLSIAIISAIFVKVNKHTIEEINI